MSKEIEYVFGVFEGGGAKGTAYAGVIRACEENRIRFEGACGVSAGSIAAALVASGLSAKKIEEKLTVPLSDIFADKSGCRISRAIRTLRMRATLRGLHSSEGIQRWMESALQEALGLNRTVYFKDLPRPLAILAYDAQNGRAHIWSTRSTKDQSVAFAVRASCSLPFYFSSADTGNSRFYDGGILENAPSFLIDELTGHTVLPALAFRLGSSETKIIDSAPSKTAMNTLLEKSGAVVGARSEITRPWHMDVREIEIDCGNVLTTSFDMPSESRNALVNAGKLAVMRYLEKLGSQKQFKPEKLEEAALVTSKIRHATLLKTGQIIDAARSTIDIFAGDVSWLEELAPYLINAYHRKVKIRLLTQKHSAHGLAFASRIGVNVGLSTEDHVFRGTIADAALGSGTAIFIEKNAGQVPLEVTRIDFPRLVSACSTIFEKIWRASEHLPAYSPVARPLAKAEIEAALLHVAQYSKVWISVEELDLSTVRPACKYVETFKLDRISQVKDLYKRVHAEYGYSIVGTPWYSVLPIVEQVSSTGNQLVVIDGTHRAFDSFQNGAMMEAFVVKGCSRPLPSEPEVDWNHVRLTTAKLDRKDRFKNYDGSNFREIKSSLSSYFQTMGDDQD
jgi:predicted acylesterase/phospholipase RssA